MREIAGLVHSASAPLSSTSASQPPGVGEAQPEPAWSPAALRREGLYSLHLIEWRRARDTSALRALDRRRGRKPTDQRDAENARLR